MKKLHALLVAGTCALGATVLAQPSELTWGDKAGGTYNAPETHPKVGAAPAQPEGKEMGEHEMPGVVSQVEREKGLVSVITSEGTLRLHFPPAAIADLMPGNRITTVLAFAPSPGAAVRAGDAPAEHAGHASKGKELGAHSMGGTITNIDHATGMLSLNTTEGPLQLHFPSPAIRNLKEGDRITVSLAYYKGQPSEKNK